MSGYVEEIAFDESKKSEVRRGPRKWLSASAKLGIVQESYAADRTVAEVARHHNVGISSLIKWRKQAQTGGLMSMKNDEELVPASEVKKLKKELRTLERMLGKKTLQVELLKDAIELAREKKLISRQPLPGEHDIADD